MFPLSVQRRIDEVVLPFGPTPNDRQIFLLHLLPLHQQPKSACSRRCFRYPKQPAGLAVEPIHNRNLTAAGDLECEQLTQFFPQVARTIRFRGMTEKKWRLLDDDVIVGLINDIEME